MEPSQIGNSLSDSPTFDGKSCFKAPQKLALDLTITFDGEVLYLRFNQHDIIMAVKERLKRILSLPPWCKLILTKVDDETLLDLNYATLSDYMLMQHTLISVIAIHPGDGPLYEGDQEDQARVQAPIQGQIESNLEEIIEQSFLQNDQLSPAVPQALPLGHQDPQPVLQQEESKHSIGKSSHHYHIALQFKLRSSTSLTHQFPIRRRKLTNIIIQLSLRMFSLCSLVQIKKSLLIKKQRQREK
ncbi:hypothetical protein FGO68_gene5838 [Halteria grandinella]|uniref:Ubiquitin-like domain-containing protein n=1 Tax=Halteria grandinella TaxID=5974 RepID=A0A8J8NXH6_HALGN|nr:hypothetical protein FGO68_gene5838 [Halteria grandinella]